MSITSENIRLIFGLKLLGLRQESGYSLSELSKLSSISKSYLNEIEKGKKYPKPEKITKLAKIFQVNYEELVSLRLNKRLAPISELIKFNLLNEMPLDFLGVAPADIFGLLAKAPTKFSAFVDAIIQIGRDHDVQVESLYFSVLRSFQEMHDNYFPDIELQARQFRKNYELSSDIDNLTKELIQILQQKFKYEIRFDGFTNQPLLHRVRYLFIPGELPVLLINKNITPKQLLFILAREAGLNDMRLNKRPNTSSWIQTQSFEHVLNNFKAYYFASALLLDGRLFTKGLVDFTRRDTFNTTEVIDLMEANYCSAETFMLRITNLVPYYFRFPFVFFARYDHRLNGNTYHLSKRLRGSGLSKSSSADYALKVCQRWAALNTLNLLESSMQKRKHERPICTIFKLHYDTSDQKYLIITVAYPMLTGQDMNSCVSVGFLINERFRKYTSFINDISIQSQEVKFSWLEENYKNFEDGITAPNQIKYEEDLIELRHLLEEYESELNKG